MSEDKIKIENKYLSVTTDNEDFHNLFNISRKNIRYYFAACLNTKEKVRQYIKETNTSIIKLDDDVASIIESLYDVRPYHAPEKDDCTEYCDMKRQNSNVYDDFIENLMRKSHARQNITFVDYITANFKKADVVFSHFFDNPKICVSYHTSPIMMCFNFNQNGLNIVYMLNNLDNNKSMLDITISQDKKIISTEVYFNGEKSNENEMITLSSKQLDYLIILSHYTDGEEVDFRVEKYVDDILSENYQDLMDYIKVKEMMYI